MNLRINLGLSAIIVLFVALGAVQGNRLDGIQEAEDFYRWLLTASTHMRREASLEFTDTALTQEPLDDEVFAETVELAEQLLPDFPVDQEKDIGTDGVPFSKLLRAVRQNEDQEVWAFASGRQAEKVRDDFVNYASEGRLQSVGTQFSTAALYEEDNQVFGVGIASMFFGFRKLAANFLWLQVDKYWHLGQMHRCVPIMRTTVALDPNFVDAYQLGAWHMAYNITAKIAETEEKDKKFHPVYKKRLGLKEEWYYIGADFLKDGIRKNPRDYRLYFDLGYGIYETKLGDYPNTVRYLNAALDHPHVPYVARMYYHALSKNGQYEDSTDGWYDYLENFEGHSIALNSIESNSALLAEAMHDEALECLEAAETAMSEALGLAGAARARGDGAAAAEHKKHSGEAGEVAEQMRKLAAQQKAEALAIWERLFDEENDGRAESRIARFDALDLAEEGRGFEAIQLLEHSKWAYPLGFDEAKLLILDIKREFGLEFNVAEQLDIERQQEAAPYLEEDETPVIHRLDCRYRAEDSRQARAVVSSDTG